MAVNRTTDSLRQAISRMQRGPLRKLVSSQTHKLLVRGFDRFRNKGTIKKAALFFGDNMEVVLPEVISEAIYTYGFFDEVVTGFIVSNVKPGDVVIDVGAHFGYFSLLAAHLVGSSGHVYAMEPTPSTFAMLRRNVTKKANVTCLNVAAGDTAATCQIKDYGIRYCAWNTLAMTSRMPNVLNRRVPEYIWVDVIRLDDFVLEHDLQPDLLKIDAENYEEHVIKGLEDTIKRRKPKIILEMGSVSSLSAAQLLHSHGYRLYVSRKLGSIVPYSGLLTEANRDYKDGLFLPASSR